MAGARVGSLGGLVCSMPRIIRGIAHSASFVSYFCLFDLCRVTDIFLLRRLCDVGIVAPDLLLRLLTNRLLLMTCLLVVQLQQIFTVLNLLLWLLGYWLDMEKHLGLRIGRHSCPHRHRHITIRIVIRFTTPAVIRCRYLIRKLILLHAMKLLRWRVQTSLLQIDQLILIRLWLRNCLLLHAKIHFFQLTPLSYLLNFLRIRYLLQSAQVFTCKAIKAVHLLADLGRRLLLLIRTIIMKLDLTLLRVFLALPKLGRLFNTAVLAAFLCLFLIFSWNVAQIDEIMNEDFARLFLIAGNQLVNRVAFAFLLIERLKAVWVGAHMMLRQSIARKWLNIWSI